MISLRSKRFPCGLRTRNESQRPREKLHFLALFHFSRDQNWESRSSVFLCSETKRKRLLRRLIQIKNGLIPRTPGPILWSGRSQILSFIPAELVTTHKRKWRLNVVVCAQYFSIIFSSNLKWRNRNFKWWLPDYEKKLNGGRVAHF